MLDNVERLLKRVKRQQMEMRLYMGNKWKPIKGLENLVFLQPTGTPLYKGYMKKHLDNVQKQIRKDGYEFERITPHTFLHTFINVNIKMYIFDHLRMYIFAILPLDRYIFLSDKIFL